MRISAKLVCILTLFSAAYAQDVQQKKRSLISGDRILVKEKNVAKLLANRAYYRKTFTGLKVLMSAYGLYSGVCGVCDFFGIPLSETYVKLSDVTLAQKRDTETYTQRIARSLGQTVITTAAHLGFYYMFSKAEEQYGSAPDIRWFVTIKNPFYATLRELYFLAQESALSKKPEELNEEMAQLLNKLIDQTENIIAFMRHKKEQFPEGRKIKAEQIIQHLIDRVEVLYGDVARALQADTYNVTFHLDSVLMLLEGDCARFARCEKSSWINPSVILGMMQSMA